MHHQVVGKVFGNEAAREQQHLREAVGTAAGIDGTPAEHAAHPVGIGVLGGCRIAVGEGAAQRQDQGPCRVPGVVRGDRDAKAALVVVHGKLGTDREELGAARIAPRSEAELGIGPVHLCGRAAARFFEKAVDTAYFPAGNGQPGDE